MNLTRHSVLRLVLSWSGFYLALLGVEVALGLGHGFGVGGVSIVPFGATDADIQRVLGGSDFALYLLGAKNISVSGLRTFTGTFGMYPPGLSYLEWPILLHWPNAPVFAILFFISLGLWSIFLTLLSLLLNRIFALTARMAFVLPLSLLLFPFFTQAYLWSAIGLTECIATPFFAIACVWFLLLISKPHSKVSIFAVFIGFLFAASAYTRAQFDLIFTALTIVSLLCLAWHWHAKKLHLRYHALALLCVFTAYQAATIPYKIFKHAPTIVIMDFTWERVWVKREDAAKYNVMLDAGMQSICEVDPVKCQSFTERRNAGEAISFSEYKRTALITAFRHPLRLLQIKLPLFWHDWGIDMFQPDTGLSYRRSTNLILLLGLPFTGLYALWRNRPVGIAVMLYSAAFISSCLLYSLLVHIEPRYFLPIKLLSAVMILFVAADRMRRPSNPDTI